MNNDYRFDLFFINYLFGVTMKVIILGGNGYLGFLTAIEFAEKGFRILPLESERQKGVKKYLLEFEGSKFHFLNSNGNSFKSGDLVIQMDLAKTLKKIANEGKKGFYEGEVARKIVSDIQSNGGILTIEDLKNYNALDSKVVKGFFNGNDIFSLNLPSFGAITIQTVSYPHLTLPTNRECRSRWSPYH